MCLVGSDIPLSIQGEQLNDPDALGTPSSPYRPFSPLIPANQPSQFPYLFTTQLPSAVEGIRGFR